jgi:hypothetical protein
MLYEAFFVPGSLLRTRQYDIGDGGDHEVNGKTPHSTE